MKKPTAGILKVVDLNLVRLLRLIKIYCRFARDAIMHITSALSSTLFE